MKIAFNPSTVAALITPPNNKDITFDLRGRNIFARGVKFCGTDTNTWRDIKINNVSIGSNTLDLRNGSNTTLTNTNGVVTINSTWRPVVDNLTSDSTTSSLSAKQGKVLKSLIDGKSDSGHNHDDRYVKKSGDTMSGVLTIDTTNFGALTIKRNDDANGASIQFRGKSSVYGYIGLNNSTKDKQFLRWGSDTSKTYTILDTSSTYVSNGKGIINGTTITLVSNADTTDGVHLEWSGQLTYDLYSWLAGWTNDGKKIKAVNKSLFATSGHTHDNRYLKLSGGTMQLGEGLKFHADENYFGTDLDARIISLLDWNGKICDGGLIIDERATFDGKEYVTELLRIRDSEFKWKGSNILHSGNSNINGNTITINGSSLTVSKSDHTHAYLPLSGGTMTGSIKFNYNSLPQKTLSYVCGIDAFVDGGEMGWMRGSDFVVQYAPTKTGLGASGTWDINITGDADTVDGVHVIWNGSITKTNWLAAWENYTTIRCISPANVTVGNSDKVDGFHATSGNNKPWGTIPAITTNGLMDVGKQFEFHYDNTTGSDYSTILRCTGNYSNIIDLPSISGTLALTSQIPNVTNYYWANIKISDTSNSNTAPTFGSAIINTRLSIAPSTLTKTSPTSLQLVINGPYLDDSVTPGLKDWPGIGFHMPGRTWGSLIFNGNITAINSDYNGYVNYYGAGFRKNGSSDSYVLLGGGGHKALSDFMSSTVKYALSDTIGGKALLAYKLYYSTSLKDLASIDNFHEAYTLKCALWNGNLEGMGSSFPGTINGIILSGGWTDTKYGFQLAIDDDPNYFIALRQRNKSTWYTWKRIPMGDGTGASGTWGINISGNAVTATSAGNADTLDGLDSTKFLRQVVVPNNTENDFNTFSNMTLTGRVDPTTGASLKNAPWSGSGPAGGYGVLTYLFSGYGYGTQMAWGYGNNRIYIRNKYYSGHSEVGAVWRTSWDTLALTSDIPTSLKNPNSLILKANGTTLAIYDGSSAKEANFTYANVGAASASHTHSNYVTDLGTSGNYLTWTKNGNTSNITVPYAGKTDWLIPQGFFSTKEQVDAFFDTVNHSLKVAYIGNKAFSEFSDGLVLAASVPKSYCHQIHMDDNQPVIHHRSRSGNGDSWSKWSKLLDSSNYSSYAIPVSASCNKNWSYSGQSGQPTWLWGTNDGTNCYVWNPSNFSVNYANSANTSNRTKFLETFRQDSTTDTYGTSYPIWAQWANSTNVRLKCTNYTVWTDKADYATSAGNADTVDGYHENSFIHWLGTKSFKEFDTIYSGGIYNMDGNPSNADGLVSGSWNQTVFNVSNYSPTRQKQLIFPYESDTIYYRRRVDSGWTPVKTIAFSDSNVASASKLQTPRTIWGQSFDGTADVNGTIYINNSNSSEGAIRLNNNINSNARISAIDSQVIFNTDAAIRFGGTSWDWNVWAGLKYTHSNKTIYLGIADGSVFNANSALSGGSLRFPGISNVYATTFNGSLSGNASTATNADKVDGVHLNGIFTAFGNNAHNITATIGGVTKSFLVNWAADSDKLDGYHENSFLRYRETTSIDLENTLWDLIGIKLYNGALPDNLTNVYNYGSVISLPCTSTRFEIYASELASLGNGLYYRSGWRDTKRPWLKFIDSSNIGSQSVNYANSAGNADKLDGIHANGLLTSVTNTNNGISVTVGGTTKSVSNISVNYAASAGNAASATNAYHLRINSADTWSTWYWAGLSGQPSWLWGSNDGTNMYVWNPSNFRVAYATSAGSADTALYLRSLGNLNCQTGRTLNYGDVYTYNTYDGNTGSPTTFTSVIGFGRGIAGTVEIAGGWDNTNLYWRSLRDCCEDWHSWRTVLDSSNYSEFINNYYWANVKISASSSTTTSPTVSNLTATSSIRMGNIYLLNTNEINSTSGIHLNYQNSGNVSLCYGGGNVGIGTISPSYKLDVNGLMRSNGFHHGSVNSDDYMLLAGGGYSKGVPVRYWAIYYIYIGNSSETIICTKRSGNYNFITSEVRESGGSAIFNISFPSGYNKNNTLIFGNGDHRIKSELGGPVYVTITTSTDFNTASKIRIMISDNKGPNPGYANIYFMCMG